ncbi:hypothetical protein MACJ_003766 [Theileria orientalis]|uniref:Uncharacterized protein n=1 Tax=Theileria orientalis TaxID=68886 RepID=A0A976XKC7_THEOR|nr:hypothetical protein MACJ_003766 [Theileria orientalis]
MDLHNYSQELQNERASKGEIVLKYEKTSL